MTQQQPPKCPNCGPLGNDHCAWAGRRAIPDAMVSDAILCMCGSCAYCLERTRIAIPNAAVR